MVSMNKKIENLRKILNGREVTWDELQRICSDIPTLPCVESLKNHGVLKKTVEEYEEVLTEEEWKDVEESDDYYNYFHWDEDRKLYVIKHWMVWYNV